MKNEKMSECIVCGKKLSPTHEWLNFEFHSHCAKSVIETFFGML